MESSPLFSLQGSTRQPPGYTTANAPTGSSGGPNPGLGLTALAPAVQCYFRDRLASSTQRTYYSAMKRFSGFCDHYQVHDPFPVTEGLLCSFVAFLADARLVPHASLGEGVCNLGWSLPNRQGLAIILHPKKHAAGGCPAKITNPVLTSGSCDQVGSPWPTM